MKGILEITAWPDPLLDRLGHDPRSPYAETFWLAIIGPSTLWLMRRLAADLEARPDGLRVAVSQLARVLGLGTRDGMSAGLERAVLRACRFDLARMQRPGRLAVRRCLPPLTRVQVERLPARLRQEHARWMESQPTGLEAMRRRSRQLALSLLELGEDVDAAERQLLRWRYHPALAHESAEWAARRHRDAARAAAEGRGTAQAAGAAERREAGVSGRGAGEALGQLDQGAHPEARAPLGDPAVV